MVVSADAIRYFLHVARRGRLVAAAAVLGVEHTTVGRQISRLEHDLGERLFDRSPAGWTITDAGRRLLPHAEAIEMAMQAAVAASGESGGRLSGTVRIATPDAFGAFLLAPGLQPLRRQHPDLDVQIVTSTRNIALGMREFDVAVTLEEPRSRLASHRKLTDYTLGLYATDAYLAENAEIRSVEDLRQHPFVWYVDDLLDITPLRTLEDLLPGQRVAIQTNSVAGHWQAAAAGLGIAILPRYLGDRDPALTGILLPQLTFRRSYWLTIPNDLARHARVRAVVDLLGDVVSKRRSDLLAGVG